MGNEDVERLQEELKTAIGAVKQLKEELDTVKAELHTVHVLVSELPTGRTWSETRSAVK